MAVTRQDRLNRLKDRIIALQERALLVCEISSRSFSMSVGRLEALSAGSDDDIVELGLSREEVEIMLEARRPSKDSSAGLRMAHEANERLLRGMKEDGQAHPDQSVMVWIPEAQQPKQLNVIDVVEPDK